MREFKAIVAAAVAGVLLAASSSSRGAEPLGASTQLVVVITQDWNAVEGHLQRYQRAHPGNSWKPVGAPIAVVVGKKGMGWGVGLIAADRAEARTVADPVKVEGDGKSPAGIFPIRSGFGYSAHPPVGWKLSYTGLTASVECVDDSASRYYNRIVDRASVSPDWHSSEHMAEAGDAYRWGAVIDQNAAAVPHGGSCVFLHVWGGPDIGTSGCTAMAQDRLEPLLAWLDPGKAPVLVQLPDAQFKILRDRWHLPKFPGK